MNCFFCILIKLLLLNYCITTEEKNNDHCTEDGNCEQEHHNILNTDSHYMKDTLGNYESIENANNEDETPGHQAWHFDRKQLD